ncbi:MAG: hypothetical protein IH984_02575 [Planctomycetes bacterium]|nr:hypothetical protein [Planctomycetota bacterium]
MEEDVACRKCDYNLRGITPDSCCPECETAIECTLHPSLLRFSDYQWLSRVRSGLSLMLLFIIVVIVMNIFWMVATFVFDIGFSEDSVGLELCIAIFIIIFIVLETISYLRITTLESSEQSANGRITARKLARIALIASIIAGVIAMMSDTNSYTAFFPDVIEIPLLASISYWTSHASSLLSIVGMFALFDYAHSFAKRFPEDRLAKTTRRVMWGYMIPIIAFSIWFIAIEIANKYDLIDHSSMTISNVYMVVQIVIGVPILVFGIYGIVLIFKYRNQFTKAMKLATKQRELLISQINLENSAATVNLNSPLSDEKG